MKKLLLLTFLFTSFLCEAQNFHEYFEWQKRYEFSSSVEYSQVQKIVNIGDNDFYLAGNYHGSYDAVRIVKIDKTGSKKWEKFLSATLLWDMIKTTNNELVFACSMSPASSVNGKYEVWRLDSSGVHKRNYIYRGGKNDQIRSIKQTADGGYILGGYSNSNILNDKTEICRGGYDYWVIKLDSAGAIQWQKTIGGSDNDYLKNIQLTSDGGYIIGGDSYSSLSGDKSESTRGFQDLWIVKLNATGQIQWQKTIGGDTTDVMASMVQTTDGGYLIGSTSYSRASFDKSANNKGESDYWIIKIDSVGNIQWQRTLGGRKSETLKVVQKSNYQGYLIAGYKGFGISGDITESIGSSDGWLVNIDSSGNIKWQKAINFPDNDATFDLSDFVQISDNKLLISGSHNESFLGKIEYAAVSLRVINNPDKIEGKVFQSQNTNCVQEANEKGILNIILKTEPQNFYGVSDTAGKYTILTDTGSYQVRSIFPQILKPFLQQTVCPSSGYHTISFSQYKQDTTEINFANYEKQCAYLKVELSHARMRRCFDNYTAVKYCNIGNIDTSNVQVIVTLPEYMTFVSATNPNYTISGKKITFNIGVLHANECGRMILTTKVDCVNGITGLTQCISAYILPRNKCVDQIQPDYALWDKSEVSVDGRCTGNTARFVIKNIGQNNMTDSSSYRIYKDAVQAVSRRFKLNAGDSLVINVTALGFTYRLEADQVLHFPSASTPNITIENCGTGAASRGFVSQMPQNTVAPDVEKICLPIRDSYDPNDKLVSPSGVGTNKLVKHKVPLDYLIRFQNTGTDTAYKVVIVDTLNQNLDLSTLEFGASSHTYKIEFTGSGKPILKFTFDKINLVDSFTNEPKSHGFVSFKITPYDSIPNGTLVKNSADIYFDFNLPIKTNTTQVSIDDRLPTGATLSFVTAVKEQKANYEAIYVYPNPFTNSTNFEFVYNTKATQLIVYNINGELVANENITNQTTYQFHRNNLSNGMYFYVIQNKEGETIGRGKLVLQ